MEIKKYNFIVLFIMCMQLLSSCGNAQIDLENAQAVRIVCEKQSGSGVVYDMTNDQVVIVTAAHVVEDAATAKVVWGIADENRCEISDIVVIPGLDLAFLKIENATARWSVRQNMQKSEQDYGYKISLRARNASGELWEISGTISEEWIYVEDFCCHMMLGNAEAAPGMSGGGAFNENGEFQGIVCGIDEDNHVAILPAAVIASEYDVVIWE